MKQEPPELTMSRLETEAEYARLVFDYQREEGWNPSVYDSKTDRSYAGFRNIRLWRVGGEDLMICSFVKNKPLKLVFWGCYVTNPKFRGLGVSYRLFREQFDRLVAKGYRVLCCAVSDIAQKYVAKLGLNRYGLVHNLELAPEDFTGARDLPRLHRATLEDLDRLAEFDFGISGFERKRVLASILGEPGIKVFVAEEGGRVAGFAALTRGVDHFNMFPLYSLSKSAVEALLSEAVRWVPPGLKIIMDLPTAATEDGSKLEFVTQLGFKKMSDYEMLGQAPYPCQFPAIYGIAGSQLWF